MSQGAAAECYFVNGAWVRPEHAVVPVEDRGFQLADGLYEVIRVYRGRPFAVDRHLARLEASAAAIELSLPVPGQEIAALVEEAARRRAVTEGQVYIQVTRGVAPRVHHFPPESEPSLIVYASEGRIPDRVLWEKGASAILLSDERWLRCDIKSIGLLPNVLAKEKARRAGVYEAIFERDGKGVTEGASANVFIARGGRLITAPAGQYILRGVTRDLVIELARSAGVEVEERFFTREELFSADEAFLTSTMSEVMPLVRVDGQAVGTGLPGPLSRRLLDAYRALIARAASY